MDLQTIILLAIVTVVIFFIISELNVFKLDITKRLDNIDENILKNHTKTRIINSKEMRNLNTGIKNYNSDLVDQVKFINNIERDQIQQMSDQFIEGGMSDGNNFYMSPDEESKDTKDNILHIRDKNNNLLNSTRITTTEKFNSDINRELDEDNDEDSKEQKLMNYINKSHTFNTEESNHNESNHNESNHNELNNESDDKYSDDESNNDESNNNESNDNESKDNKSNNDESINNENKFCSSTDQNIDEINLENINNADEIKDINKLKKKELILLAKHLNLKVKSNLTKNEIIESIENSKQ
jgi:hypothetical protein